MDGMSYCWINQPDAATSTASTASPYDHWGAPEIAERKISNKKAPSKRAKATFIATEQQNFMHVVQMATGVGFGNGTKTTSKAAPKKRSYSDLQQSATEGLPILDTSAMWLEQHQQTVAVRSPKTTPAPVMMRSGSFKYQPLSSFPTLESWEVVW